LNNQSSTIASTEEEDGIIEFVPLENLIQTAKVEGEGFDFLFSNKPGGGSGPTMNEAFGSPNKAGEDMFAGMNVNQPQSNTMDFTQFNAAGQNNQNQGQNNQNQNIQNQGQNIQNQDQNNQNQIFNVPTSKEKGQ